MRDIVSIARSRSLGAHRREAEAAVAERHRGDAVPARDRAPRVPLDLRVVVGVQVDEAGRDDQAVRVEHALGARLVDAPDLRDPAAADADVGA